METTVERNVRHIGRGSVQPELVDRFSTLFSVQPIGDCELATLTTGLGEIVEEVPKFLEAWLSLGVVMLYTQNVDAGRRAISIALTLFAEREGLDEDPP